MPPSPTTAPPKKRKEKKPKHAPPLYYASVTQTADEAPARVGAASMAGADDGVLSRIKKCLQRARDAGAAEQEAKAALHLASKLMKQLNVTQADVLAHEDEEERKKHGGQSMVELRRRDGDRSKGVPQVHWLPKLSYAIQTFFDCKYYTIAKATAFETTFYGIAENTVAAAEAYCMVYNLMVEWARPYKGTIGKGSYCLGVSQELQRTANKERDEEERRAKEKEDEEVKSRAAQEVAERQVQLDRLAAAPEDHEPVLAAVGSEEHKADHENNRPSTPDPLATGDSSDNSDDNGEHTEWEEWNGFSDDDDSDDGIEGSGWSHAADFDDQDDDNDSGLGDFTTDDVDAQIDNLVAAMNPRPNPADDLASERSPSASPNADDSGTCVGPETQANSDGQVDPVTLAASEMTRELEAGADHAPWASHMQLIRFRDAAGSIADNFIKDSEIKLYTSRKRKAVQYDWDAYDHGVKDSKKIDVRRKTLCDGHVDLITGGAGALST